jgi:hypothetical protein
MGGWVVLRQCALCMQWLCCGFVFGDMDSCQDVPQYKVMKYRCDNLVFRIILSSLLSELQVMIPKVDRNVVCICMVYPTLWPGVTAECVYRPPLSIVPHTPTRIHSRTHTGSSSNRTEILAGGIPAVGRDWVCV